MLTGGPLASRLFELVIRGSKGGSAAGDATPAISAASGDATPSASALAAAMFIRRGKGGASAADAALATSAAALAAFGSGCSFIWSGKGGCSAAGSAAAMTLPVSSCSALDFNSSLSSKTSFLSLSGSIIGGRL